jgi:hypothetical protein
VVVVAGADADGEGRGGEADVGGLPTSNCVDAEAGDEEEDGQGAEVGGAKSGEAERGLAGSCTRRTQPSSGSS